MGRKVAAGLAFVGMASLVVVGVFAKGVSAAEAQSPGSPAAGPGAAPVDLPSLAESTDAGPATKAAPQGVPTVPVRQKSAAGKKPPVPGKAPDSPKGEPAPEKAPAAGEDAKKAPPSAAPGPGKPSTESPAQPKPTLSPQMTALRDRVRAVVAHHFREPLNTDDNPPAQILKFCLAYGCDTEIRYGGSAGSAMSGIGCLCYGYSCAGYRLFAVDDRKVLARVGYGLQDSPGELLAVLAQSAVPESYEIRVGQWRGTVSSLVESEKLSCLPGGDLSQKLIGLSHYLPDGAAWKNAGGDAWSLERLVRDELNRSPASDRADATDHLMGLAYALDRHVRDGRPADGQYERVQKFLAEYQDFALGLQNADGSWNPAFFAARGASRNASGLLRATGHILEWLVASLPADRLQDRRVVLSVAFVAALLEGSYAQANVANASTREIDSVMHAVHALKIYDRRVFKPAEPEKPEKPDAPQTEAARQRNAAR